MQSVAARLGVTPMALYRHVADKADLLDGMVERRLTELPPHAPELSWPERLSSTAREVRHCAQCHPRVFPLLLQRPATPPAARRVRDHLYPALRQAGVDPGHVTQIERLISTAVLGFAVSEVSGPFQNHSREVLDADFDRLLQLLAV